jgi:hypothetical protein
MNRREFLVRVGGTLVAVPMVLEAISCGSNTGPGPPVPTDQFSSTSTSSSGHTHSITVQCTTLTQNGFTYTSSVDSGHSHDLTLTVGQLQQIAAGNPVGPVTSTNSGGHTHEWTIQKPAGVC